ncbi:branched-chain amino acid ABC transporter permease [Marinobacterium lutimaris]|uniref:Amino acid/amide ABC transporter membrane protein 2, HAAT family n=1 Tax=Marinobacterium lutimaris TaxID=568106 RepID=A0A1H6DVZ6_9GAMM|nr:branched-chain amino acid ABC transporter permease [Marinobacterium lutimaris]SEG88903.1 amino acid/amide ABC transporter membrane protein 2, HAAT family [Marinobacterium lutimaris]
MSAFEKELGNSSKNISKILKSKSVSWSLVVLTSLLLAPFIGVYPVLILKILCFALFACSFNLLIGFTGLLSFGHAAFFGGAGYIFGYFMKSWGIPAEIGIILGVGFGAILGYVIGSLAIKRQGIYFAMITLALAQMVYFIFLQTPFTGGEDGLQGIPRGKLFGFIPLDSDLVTYYFVLGVVLLAFLAIVRIVNSPYGQILRAIKENEPRAVSLGYDTNRFKLIAFVTSASFSALAGSLKALVLGFATLTDVHWTMSGSVILMTLVGGLGTLTGPILGAVLIVMLENKIGEIGFFLAEVTGIQWFETLGQSVPMVTGIIFIICVLSFRQGIVGIFTRVCRPGR